MSLRVYWAPCVRLQLCGICPQGLPGKPGGTRVMVFVDTQGLTNYTRSGMGPAHGRDLTLLNLTVNLSEFKCNPTHWTSEAPLGTCESRRGYAIPGGPSLQDIPVPGEATATGQGTEMRLLSRPPATPQRENSAAGRKGSVRPTRHALCTG